MLKGAHVTQQQKPSGVESHPRQLRIQGQTIVLEDRADVLRPTGPSLFLAQNLRIGPGERACDIGTGTGLYAVLAAKLGAKESCGSDILASCVDLAQQNARLNHVEAVCDFRQGDLCEPFNGESFDVIVSNPPQTPDEYLEAVANTWQDLWAALHGGRDGTELPIRLVEQARHYLAQGGRLYLMVIEWWHWQDIIRAMSDHFANVREAARQRIPLADLSPSFLDHAIPVPRLVDKWGDDALTVSVYEAWRFRGTRTG